MSQYIIVKERLDGTLVAGTPPRVHCDFDDAKQESERLAAMEGTPYLIFKACAKSERVQAPVKTQFLS